MASDLVPLSGLMQINEATKKKSMWLPGEAKGKSFLQQTRFHKTQVQK